MNLQEIRDQKKIKPFIEALLVEMQLDEHATVFDSAIELSGGYVLDMEGWKFLYLFLQATPAQIQTALDTVS